MTDYLEEVLDQLEEEAAHSPARWTEVLWPVLAETPGSPGPWEMENVARIPVEEALAGALELQDPVQAEESGAQAPPAEAETFPHPAPPEAGEAARSAVRSKGEERAARGPGDWGAPDWNVPQADALAETAGKRLGQPALLARAKRLERALGQARREGSAVRSAGMAAGAVALPGRAERLSGAWSDSREDPAAAVDRAFQRDSRRYDQGFALY